MLRVTATGNTAHQPIRKVLCAAILCIATLGVGACDYGNPKPKKFKQTPFETSRIADEREMAKPATIDDGLSVNGISITKERGTPKKAREDMASIKGLKTDTLFTNEAKDDAERFARLETAVQKLSAKIDSMSPAIVRLTEIDKDLNSLTSQLEVLISTTANMQATAPAYREAKVDMKPRAPEEPAMAKAPTPSPAIPQALNDIASASGTSSSDSMMPPPKNIYKTPPPIKKKANAVAPKPAPVATRANVIKNLRIGDHANKTRIVFETAEKPDLAIMIDDFENLMSAELGNTSIAFNADSLNPKSSLISAVQSGTEGTNTVFIFDLSKGTRKTNQGYIPPSEKNPNHRVFIDLAR